MLPSTKSHPTRKVPWSCLAMGWVSSKCMHAHYSHTPTKNVLLPVERCFRLSTNGPNLASQLYCEPKYYNFQLFCSGYWRTTIILCLRMRHNESCVNVLTTNLFSNLLSLPWQYSVINTTDPAGIATVDGIPNGAICTFYGYYQDSDGEMRPIDPVQCVMGQDVDRKCIDSDKFVKYT